MTPASHPRSSRALVSGGLLLLTLGLVLRAWLLATYPPMSAGDSGTYVQAARDLLAWDFSVGQARRTPGYPLLLALLGVPSPTVVMVVHVLAGGAVTFLLYCLVRRATQRRDWALMASGVCFFNLQQLFQEATLLTETWSALTVTGVVVWIGHLARSPDDGKRRVLSWFGLGTLAAHAIFVRPQFVFFVAMLPAVALLMHSGWRWPTGRALTCAAVVTAPMLAAIFGWAAVVKQHTGYFTLSTQSGFGMVNQAIDYVELASDRYAVAREVLVRTRDARIAEAGHSRNTIWYAWPELQRRTGWTLPEASAELQRMSMDLFARHPLRYARGVFSAWVDYWTVPIFWQTDRIRPPALADSLGALWWVQHKLLRLANVLFVLACAAALVSSALRRRWRWDLATTTLAVTVFASSLVQALFDQGASSRYVLPTQPLVVALILVLVWRSWESPGKTLEAAAREPG